MRRNIIIGIFTMTILTSCYYDHADKAICAIGNPTYPTVNQVLSVNHCYECHGSTPANGAPFSLDTYEKLKAQVDAGRLLGAIRHESGFAPMPQSHPKMSDCEIAQIENWVSAGMPQ